MGGGRKSEMVQEKKNGEGILLFILLCIIDSESVFSFLILLLYVWCQY